MVTNDETLFEKVVNLSKRRGFIFQSAEIYGGFRSTYDYGPIGVQLLRNVKDQWWRTMVQLRHDVVGLDASILSPPAVWEASGHLTNFSDPLVDAKNVERGIDKTNLRILMFVLLAVASVLLQKPENSILCLKRRLGRW